MNAKRPGKQGKSFAAAPRWRVANLVADFTPVNVAVELQHGQVLHGSRDVEQRIVQTVG